ncbi:MAG: hypothetical protein J1F22_04100 [Lachnospiraceae bacterium]|nr:hypothetical protein [Lachnospiraceae bacterium]
MSERKIIPYRKRFRPNLAFFIFLLILIYIIVLGWNYLTREHISIYEVNTSDISDDAPIYGFIMREEEIVTSEGDGYINYYNAEGGRIKTGSVVYTIDTNGEVSSLLEQLQSSRENTESISTMRETIASFQNSFSLSAYGQVSAFKYAVNNVIFEQSRGSLYSDLNKAVKSSGAGKNFTKITAKKSGVIAYSIDGYEQTKQKDIREKLFEQYGMVSRSQIQKNESIKTGAPVYRLITSNDWSLVVKLDDSYYEALKKEDYIRVTIVKDNISFNASVELFDSDGVHFAKLSTSRFMERYMNDRFLEIEFHLKSASGLKIPNSSILTKDFYVIPDSVTTTSGNDKGIVKQIVTEDGKISYQFISLGNSTRRNNNYYVSPSIASGGDILRNSQDNSTYIVSSKEPVSGVYCVNEGYCKFRPIDVRYKNNEYTIISDTTKGGLSAYDHIVVDPSRLNDDDFIE